MCIKQMPKAQGTGQQSTYSIYIFYIRFNISKFLSNTIKGRQKKFICFTEDFVAKVGNV